MNWESLIDVWNHLTSAAPNSLGIFAHWFAIVSVYLFTESTIEASRCKKDYPATRTEQFWGRCISLFLFLLVTYILAEMVDASPNHRWTWLIVVAITNSVAAKNAYRRDAMLTSEERQKLNLRIILDGKKESGPYGTS